LFRVAAGVMDEELRQAQEKFEESKQLAETAMQNLLENDVSKFLLNEIIHVIVA
jgi:BAR domain